MRADSRTGPAGEPSSARPTSNDVARAAGVSQKTVSRVMNNERYVGAAARGRVLEAALALGYRPNAAARALNSGRTRRVGVIAIGTTLFGPTSILVAAERSLRMLGYGVSVVYTSAEADVHAAVQTLLAEGVDGLILSEPTDSGPLVIGGDVPVLTLERYPGLRTATSIEVHLFSEAAGYTATTYLKSLGHREIRHLAGPSAWWSARDREAGWRRALVEDALPVVEPVRGDWSPESAVVPAQRLAHDTSMTAVFVANDDMAIAAMRTLEAAGRRVPEDVSVVGVDDIPLARFVRPQLTTLSQRFDDAVADGVARLVAAVERRPVDDGVRPAGPAVIRRASSGPPPCS